MTDLTNAPAWVREIAERASKATKGPWYVVEDDDDLCMCMVGVATDPMSGYGDYGNTIAMTLLQAPRVIDVDDEHWDENAAFIAHSRTDIPRLIEAAAGMAEALEESMPEDCYAGRAMKAADCAGCEVRDMCGRGKALAALAKYRGEANE